MTGQPTADASRAERLIRDAFSGVTLEDGVGLLQGQALDDYAGPEAQAAARANDETEDWSRIPADLLSSAHSSLSFFDPKGMRFHLPAYLIAELNGVLHQDIVFHLTYITGDAPSQFRSLTPKQREAVHQFLLYRLETCSRAVREFEGPMIERAIADYWGANEVA